jgi:hypothetical protein
MTQDTQKIKYMDIREFREMGLLVELNRTFLHPLGLALEVMIDENGVEYLSGIWDYRNDPQKLLYGNINKDKMTKAQDFIKQQHAKRLNTLGYIFQE